MGAYRIYKQGTPYNASELADLDFDQTNDTMYFVHITKPPQKVSRFDHTDWRWATVTFGPTIDAPTTPTATPTGSTGDPGYSATDYDYVVTSISESGQESRASTVASCVNDLTLDNHYNTVSWTAEPDAVQYLIYKGNNGTHGYIGSSANTSFRDQNIIADLTNSPPQGVDPFAEGNYPSTVAFHGQRLIFARTQLYPNRMWGSQPGDFENMDKASPVKADDAFDRALVGRRVNSINQLLSAKSLLALTADRVFSFSALTATNFEPQSEGSRGVSRLKAIEVDETVFIKPIQGRSVRAVGYRYEVEGFQSNDVTIFSTHLFKGDTIKAWAFQYEPFSCLWAVMTSGKLLCFTWQREQEVWGWTQCDTAGTFEDVSVITENGYDRAYFIVKREIDGVERRFYERMSLPLETDICDACPLDCARTQITEEPTDTLTGAWHLEGQAVRVYADGYEYGFDEEIVVENGAVTIPVAANCITVGLPFECEVTPLPLGLATSQGSRHTETINYAEVVVRTIDTRGLEARCGTADWEEAQERTGEEEYGWVLPTTPDARDYTIVLPGQYAESQTVSVRQRHSLPWTITGMFLKPVVGES